VVERDAQEDFIVPRESANTMDFVAIETIVSIRAIFTTLLTSNNVPVGSGAETISAESDAALVRVHEVNQ